MTERQHSVLAMILVIMGLYLMRISAMEVQPLVEGDIALRAEAIATSGAWMDPSEHAVGGLSSVVSPPLPSWLAAAGVLVLGPTEIGLRLLPLIALLTLLGLTYLIASRVLWHRYAMIATSIVGLSMPMITLGRQISPEIIATSMLMLVWWSTLRIEGAPDVRTRMLFALIYAAALAAVMLSVMLFTVIALGLLVPVLLRRTTLASGVFGLLLGLVLGLPWYGIMYAQHGSDFILAQSISSSAAALRQGGTSGGPLDIVLVLIAASPLLVASMVWVVTSLRSRELLPDRSDVVLMTAGLWFVVTMILGAIGNRSATTAVIAALPVAALLSLSALQGSIQRSWNGVLLLHLGSIVTATVATLLVHLRAVSSVVTLVSIIAGVIAVLLLIVATIGKKRRHALAVRATRPVIYGAVGVTAVAAAMTILAGNPSTISGGRKVALRLLEDTAYARSFVYLHHGTVAGTSVNAQLTWYTRGWMSHRNPRYDFTPLVMPVGNVDEAVVLAGIGAPWIVYFHAGLPKEQIDRVEELLDNNYVVDEDTKHYLLFERRLRMKSDM